MSGAMNDDGTYRNSNTIAFTHGSIRLILDQSSVVAPHEAEEISTQADKVMGHLVTAAFRVGGSISDYVAKHRSGTGSSFSEGAAWQRVDRLHVRARVTVEVNRSIPEFVLSEAIELALADFRMELRAEMDPSYKAFVAEERARKAAKDLVSGLSPAAFMAAMLVGENAGLGLDGSDGVIVSGYPFGPFGDGNGFGRKG